MAVNIIKYLSKLIENNIVLFWCGKRHLIIYKNIDFEHIGYLELTALFCL